MEKSGKPLKTYYCTKYNQMSQLPLENCTGHQEYTTTKRITQQKLSLTSKIRQIKELVSTEDLSSYY